MDLPAPKPRKRPVRAGKLRAEPSTDRAEWNNLFRRWQALPSDEAKRSMIARFFGSLDLPMASGAVDQETVLAGMARAAARAEEDYGIYNPNDPEYADLPAEGVNRPRSQSEPIFYPSASYFNVR